MTGATRAPIVHRTAADDRQIITAVESLMGAFVQKAGLSRNLRDAVEYAMLGGGKRLRPLMAVRAAEAVGGSLQDALPSAAAVEMIHAFSLVHDDLPALDNDDLRRGRPTVHKAHGEAMAILVGDGLMSLAFQLICERSTDDALAGRLCLELARGTTGMIVGQVLDTLGGHAETTEVDKLRQTHRQKTGALIAASCRMGAIAGMWGRVAGEAIDEDALTDVTRYGVSVGLMFQVVDDLLDVEQSTEQLGKRSGKDADAGKLTYPVVMGVEQSKAEAARLLEEARQAAQRLGGGGGGGGGEGRSAGLLSLAEQMARRDR